MTKITSTTDRLLVAIDVAKRVHEVLVLWPSGKTRSFRVPNIRDEFERLTSFLLSQDGVGQQSVPPCGVRSTPLP